MLDISKYGLPRHVRHINCLTFYPSVLTLKPSSSEFIGSSSCYPLAKHTRKRLVLDRDIDSTCAIHHNLLADLLQRLEEFDWMATSPFFEDALQLWPVR
jgi:hypothetical protein